MSNCSMNTHRREMRAVTPVARIGRNAAGAAIAAGLMVGGGSAALAEGQPAAANPAPQVAPHEVPAAAVAIPTVTTDAAAAPAVYSSDNATALGLKATAPVAKKVKSSTTSDKATGSSKTRSAMTSRTASDEDATSEKDESATDERSSKKASSTSEDESSKDASSKDASSKASDDSSSEGASSVAGGSIVATARNGIGVPYVWAGSSRSGWDCSGFTSWVYAQHGIDLPHSASGQKAMGRAVSASEARPGDLVYTPGHIGIYAGNGQIIDAGRAGRTTSQRAMWSGASWTYVRIDR